MRPRPSNIFFPFYLPKSLEAAEKRGSHQNLSISTRESSVQFRQNSLENIYPIKLISVVTRAPSYKQQTNKVFSIFFYLY